MHTPMAQVAHNAVSWRALGHIVALSPSVSHLCLAVSQACTSRVVAHRFRVAGRLLRVVSHAGPRCVARRATPCRSPSGIIARLLRRIMAHARSYRNAVARRVAACLAIHSAARLPSCHDTPICIATHPPTARLCEHAPLAPRTGRTCHRASWPCHSVLLRASPAVSRAHACLSSSVSLYNSLYSDPAQVNGQYPIQPPAHFFFFTNFFFHLFHLLEDHKKIFFFFIF